MAIAIEDALKGHLVAAVFEVLLIDAGYQVIPTGVEKTIRELRPVDYDTYIDLIHPRLRSVPDMFVLDVEAHETWLTEIKFRRSLGRSELLDKLANQLDWTPFWLILAVACPPEEWKKGGVHHLKIFLFKLNNKT